jgi:MFS family permease
MSANMSASSTIASTAPVPTVESRRSWVICVTAFAITAISFAAPAITVVGLRSIAEELGKGRSVPALAYSLAWLGASFGGIPMGRAAERFGIRSTVIFGSAMIAVGLIVAQSGGPLSLLLGYGLFVGLLGNSGINAPLYVYVTKWFDRRRGTALALLGSGSSVSAAIWAPVFAVAETHIGWRDTMLGFAALQFVLIAPTALIFISAPEIAQPTGHRDGSKPEARVLGLKPVLVFGALCMAGFLCCVPMAMPQGHLVAFCGDMGIAPSEGTAMLSVLLGCAFVSRQFWGFLADRIGGLRTILAGSACQITAMIGFLLTRDEAGLFAVAAWFGLGFSGIIPAYVLAVRELFLASEASWRVPTVLLFTGSGMAFGGWFAGAIYDAVGFYAAAFAAGIVFNLAHLTVIGALVWRKHRATTWSGWHGAGERSR